MYSMLKTIKLTIKKVVDFFYFQFSQHFNE